MAVERRLGADLPDPRDGAEQLAHDPRAPEERIRRKAGLLDSPENPGDSPDADLPNASGPAPPEKVDPDLSQESDRPPEAASPTGRMSQQELWSRYPDDYIPPPPGTKPPDVSGPFQHPSTWAADINPSSDEPEREANCGECARAVELTWRGLPSIAAGLASHDGERDSRMMEWAGTDLEPTDPRRLEKELLAAGHGSSALIAVDWTDEEGHWFNAVNYKGKIISVDGQAGTHEVWPPTRESTGYGVDEFKRILAIIFNPDGTVRREGETT